MIEINNKYNYTDRLLEHVFYGCVFSNNVTGFHCNRNLQDEVAEIIPNTVKKTNGLIVSHKVRSISNHSIYKKGNNGYSTFFPEDWTRQEILDTVENAKYSSETGLHYSDTKDIYIRIIKRGNRIITFYPIDMDVK